MPEMKPPKTNVPPAAPIPTHAPEETPDNLDQPRQFPPADTVKAPGIEPAADNTAVAKPLSAAEAKSVGAHPILPPKTDQHKLLWVVLPVILILLLVLVFFSTRSRQKQISNVPANAQSAEVQSELSNYSAYVAKNKALKEEKYSEKILTDEPFAGQAPLAVRAAGPVITAEIDPQLAALADAFRIRVQVTQGSQSIVRGNTVTRTTKGNFRGFRINALEKIENGTVVFDEITMGTPKNGLVKTVNRVLEQVNRTDFPLLLSELQDAGLEFLPLPEPSGKKAIQGQLRSIKYWGKAIPIELLIKGNNIGNIALGMPVDQLKNKLSASQNILKRKVLVNDVYYDIYKITNQNNEPLFFIYEKEGKVWGISIISEIFKTEKGIGIGNALAVLRLYYPSVKLTYSKEKPAFVRVDGVDGIFIIQPDGDQKVISILIGESPEFE